MYESLGFKGIVRQKRKFCHHLLTLMSFQTHMRDFLFFYDQKKKCTLIGVQQLVTAVPLKGQLCTLSTPKRGIFYLIVVICTPKVLP